MTAAKKLAIWIDQSNAHLIEFKSEPNETMIIESKFTHEDKVNSLVNKGEKLMHKKEQNLQSEYFRELIKVIRNYDEVLLFGPSKTKAQLFNILRVDVHFAHIKIEIKQTDKMTENQQHAFVKDYFSNNLTRSERKLAIH